MLASYDRWAAEAAYRVLVAAGEAGTGAVLWGLSHPNPRVRRYCADFLDHQGNDDCFEALREAALNDGVPGVRCAAVHALGCQRCKTCPLTNDLVGLLVQVALFDDSARVRQEAVHGMGQQPHDARAVEALTAVLHQEGNKDLRRVAHYALMRQDPDYRRAVNQHARESGIASARAASSPNSAMR